MQKLLILLTTSLIGNSTISNINLSIKTNINTNNKNVIVNNNESDSDKLDNWHNTLSIKQDAIAKEQYLDTMNITTTKSANTNFDNYNISVDNSKLQNMLKNGIINQDVYNIWSSKDYSEELTIESNTIVYIPTLTNTEKKVREFESFFYIQNNKMFFIENKKPINPSALPSTSTMFNVSYKWYETKRITFEEYNEFVDELDVFLNMLSPQSVIDKWFRDLVEDLVERNILSSYWLDTFLAVDDVFLVSHNNFSKYRILNQIEQNIKKINDVNNKYHSGVQEYFYIFKWWLDPKSIKATPPINKDTKFDDDIKGGPFSKGVFTNKYDFNTLISYSNYDSLWEFLNSNVKFNLHKAFQSSIGLLNKYKVSNTIFYKEESSNILKKYWNHNVVLTDIKWTSSIHAHSEAEILLSITDNPWNKTINFNFTSILINSNAISATENIMY